MRRESVQPDAWVEEGVADASRPVPPAREMDANRTSRPADGRDLANRCVVASELVRRVGAAA
ncbi:MAG TPA: hypothetical protein VIM19_15090 [Actinomycetes bacterium]